MKVCHTPSLLTVALIFSAGVGRAHDSVPSLPPVVVTGHYDNSVGSSDAASQGVIGSELLRKVSIGNPAAGSMPHLLAGRLAMLGNFQITNVPFPGSGPAIPQVIGGQLAGMSSPLGDWVQHYKGGRIRILATSGPERSPYTPDVATYREQGFGELTVREWFGFFAPAGTPDAVRENLNNALRSAMSQQDIRDFVTPLAAYIESSTSADHVRRLGLDSDMARRLVTALGFKADS